MWIYEYSKFDCSGFLPIGPFDSREEAAREMRNYEERYGALVRGPIRVDCLEYSHKLYSNICSAIRTFSF